MTLSNKISVSYGVWHSVFGRMNLAFALRRTVTVLWSIPRKMPTRFMAGWHMGALLGRIDGVDHQQLLSSCEN